MSGVTFAGQLPLPRDPRQAPEWGVGWGGGGGGGQGSEGASRSLESAARLWWRPAAETGPKTRGVYLSLGPCGRGSPAGGMSLRLYSQGMPRVTPAASAYSQGCQRLRASQGTSFGLLTCPELCSSRSDPL